MIVYFYGGAEIAEQKKTDKSAVGKKCDTRNGKV